MAEAYNMFAGSQTDINRRLLRKIEALEDANGAADIADLQEAVTALAARVKALEDAS